LRSATNENDENLNVPTRVTRAKSAANLNADELAMPSKALQSKKTVANANPTRRRAALDDVSNVTKVEAVDGGKKPLTKPGLVSKATHPIQKRATTRQALTSKEVNKKVETKRSNPGSVGQKRKVSASAVTTSVKEDTPEDGEPIRKKVHRLGADIKPKASTEAKETKADEPSRDEVVPAPEFNYPTERPLSDNIKALESEDLDDPLMVAEYANDIFEYLRDLECTSVPNPQYMSHQDDLEWKTRGILIDWLVEVHTRFHLLPETLFLAVNIVDRFLSEKVVQLDRLQLVGITAMFIASKYEEVLSPHIANFRHIADDGFSEAEILSAERFILATLNYDLSYPNPMNFLRRISKADNYDIQSRTMGKYLMEISLLDHRLMAYRPSHVAAAAMYLARMILGRGEWVRES
jgi:G2/mitotic-specific cyclin 1/2